MQFSYHWLKTQANTQLSSNDFAHMLTMAGLEVEEADLAAPAFSGVVVAEVKSVEKHPDADRLNITQVDAGTGEIIQIVCGAPNVKAGIKIPCALPGAVLPGNFRIKPTKMRGQTSNGMLCSAKELGLSENADGLLILPSDAPIGQNIREYLDLDDTVFTLKITPNRTDCLSIKGLARETAALTQCEITPVAVKSVPVQSDKIFPVRIESPADCGRFLSRVIEDVDAKAQTPDWMKQRLERSGIRSVSALVDIGNYVMLELGQPMHVFDADKLNGKIIIRKAKSGETLECLNEKTVCLSENTLVVADETRALSIAGLMGGAESAVSNDTKNIVLESAWFAPAAIAGKSRQYGFGSDSSFRFERGVDFELQHDAIERTSELILQICQGRAGKITEALGNLPCRKTVTVRNERVEKLLGLAINETRIESILNALEFHPQKTENGFTVTSPSFRYDIEIEADLIEEIARVYGYENIPSNYTSGQLSMLELPETRRSRFSVYHQMAARDYQEVVSYAFVDEQWEQDFAQNTNPIRLQNPLAAQYSVMRSTLIGGLVEILKNNLNRKQNRVRIFEIARTFAKNTDGNFIQNERIGGLACGTVFPEQWGEKNRTVDFYDVKSDIENLLAGKDITFAKAEHPALHPGRTAEIIYNGQIIGFIGEIHPKWLQKYDLPQAPLVFELNMDTVLDAAKTTYQPVSKYQPSRRDLAFVLPESVSHDQLLSALHNVKNQLIKEISAFDVYRGTGLPEGMKSIAVKVILQDMDATLTDEVVEPVIAALIQAAETTNARLRV
ncbi:MAG: phenylalanine--tRNA ligase subunit beta [Neisseria sp.]|uniref:phenylalanine--tRNA ligase subunit beta n=1 Tax=Neisseria sp. TaxID=192066 RepID=UPI0026DCAB81|nr:phenylalanine--tRNA ligase subunit beta [Neisseria sp.]MDO4641771.1 phenylalanine--tRNA ligase subunit beta [Neisseria sp.]